MSDNRTFDEMVDQATQSIHLGLLEGGGKEMKGKVYLWLRQAILWSTEESKRHKGKK